MSQPDALLPGTLQACVNNRAASLRVFDGMFEVVLDRTMPWINVPLDLVLDVSWKSPTLVVSLLAPHARSKFALRSLTRDEWNARHASKKVGALELLTFEARAYDGAAWAEQTMQLAYLRTQPRRRVLVICNPSSGKGNGKRVLTKSVIPILRAAQCEMHVIETKGRADAYRASESMDLTQYDVIACIGGDGTIHEALNGLACRSDALDALKMPLASVPAGSGNGLYLSLHGAKHGFSAELATLTVIKGTAHTHELMSVTQPIEAFQSESVWPYTLRGASEDGHEFVLYYSFMSQAIGVLADIDIGTEPWRFIGDARFTIGYVLSVLQNKLSPVTVEAFFGPKGVTSQPQMYDMAKQSEARANAPSKPFSGPFVDKIHALEHGCVTDKLEVAPDPFCLKPSTASLSPPSTASWVHVDVPVSSVYVGKVPYVAQSLLGFPYASPNDELIDVLIQDQQTSACKKIVATMHGETGDHVFDNGIHYFKVQALRITPRCEHKSKKKTRRYLSIDGENVPYAPFQVEISQLRATLLSLKDDAWKPPCLTTVESHGARLASSR